MSDYDFNRDLIIFDTVSIGSTPSSHGRGGLRSRHVMRVGEPPSVDAWLRRVPEQSRCDARWLEYQEGTHTVRFHLVMWWPCREKIFLSQTMPGVGDTVVETVQFVPAVMWAAANNERTSELIHIAADEYWAIHDRWPTTAFVDAKTVNAPETLSLGDDRPEIKIVVTGWVPSRCVVVL